MKYDHFHIEYEADDGTRNEIEGGFCGYPEGWDKLPIEKKVEWWRKTATAWDVPETALILSVRLAG